MCIFHKCFEVKYLINMYYQKVIIKGGMNKMIKFKAFSHTPCRIGIFYIGKKSVYATEFLDSTCKKGGNTPYGCEISHNINSDKFNQIISVYNLTSSEIEYIKACLNGYTTPFICDYCE